jgi:small subunit ribosomal protein S17
MERKEIIGKVLSVYGKTVVVAVTYSRSHPLYLKQIKKKTKIYAHDEQMLAKVGNVVRVVETRPLSKLKRWKIVEVLSGGES